MKNIKEFLLNNIVTEIFIVLCTAAIILSDQTTSFLLEQIVVRFFRNGVLVLSLIIPVLAGLGLNFGIVLGAMSAQTAAIIITYWNFEGIGAIFLMILLSTPISVFLGILIGKLFNKTKGQEMITGMILGFFANGVYQFIFMVLVGTVIPVNNPDITISGGVGLINTMQLNETAVGALDKFITISLDKAFLYGFIIYAFIGIVRAVYTNKWGTEAARQKWGKIKWFYLAGAVVYGGAVFYTRINERLNLAMAFVDVPVFTMILVVFVALVIQFLVSTKLGQDFRSVGQNMKVAVSAGINVDKTRIIAIVISTVLAAWGQIIYIQNIGNFATYTAHEQVATFAIAALLVGGASIKKATIGQAFLGIILFHILFTVAPMAGANLFGDTQIGEYFRVFVSYGVIALALVLHTVKTVRQKMQQRQNEDTM